MDEKKRFRTALFSSLLIHVFLFCVISATGLLRYTPPQDDIIEIAFFGGGGGGGEDVIEAVDPEEPAAPEPEPEPEPLFEAPPPDPDAIIDASQVQEEAPKPAPRPARRSTVRGTGPGTGGGSGGGHGGGHGPGFGTGSGEGTGVTANPAVPPRIIRSPQPAYPSAERNAGIEGTVHIRFLIGTEGQVEDVTVVASSGNGNLDRAAISACQRWQFTAARNSQGMPVRCYASIPITFVIRR